MGNINLQPILIGDTIKLRPLKSEDFAALHLAASDPKIWQLHPDPERYRENIFKQRFFASAIKSRGALIIEELDSGLIIGSTRYYEWNAQTSEIAIGYTFVVRKHWGTGTNTELKQLTLNHIYKWASVVWFHVGKNNIRSRRAVEKIGAKLCYEKAARAGDKLFTQLYYKLDKEFFYRN